MEDFIEENIEIVHMELVILILLAMNISMIVSIKGSHLSHLIERDKISRLPLPAGRFGRRSRS